TGSDDLIIEIKIDAWQSQPGRPGTGPYLLKLQIKRRMPRKFFLTLKMPSMENRNVGWKDTALMDHSTGQTILNWKPYGDSFTVLAGMFYVGPFRNVLNITSESKHFDVKVGKELIRYWKNLRTGIKDKAGNERASFIRKQLERIF